MNEQQRTAMKMALDLAIMHHNDEGYSSLRARVQFAIKKALAEQPAQQEPVKWSDYESDGLHHNKPAQRKPLTDEEINARAKAEGANNADFWAGVRFAEEMHKVTE